MKKITTIDRFGLIGPLMAGNVLNTFYSAWILKKLSGVEINIEVEKKVLKDVFKKRARIQKYIEESVPKKIISIRTIQDQ